MAGLLVTAAMTGLYLARPAWLEFQEAKLYDLMLTRQRPLLRSGLPLVVDIDEASLAEHGQWPWPRYRVALLLGRLRNAGVAAVGLDIVFAEPDRASPSAITGQLLRDLKLEVTVSGLPDALRDYDKVLADMLRAGPFALGYYQDFAKADDGFSPTVEKACPLPPARLSMAKTPDAKPLDACLPESSRIVCPLPALARAAPAAGFINTLPDRDNIVRKTPLVLEHQGRLTSSLALATVMEAFGVKNAVIRLTAGGIESLTLASETLGRRVIPLDAGGRLLINYRGPGGTFPHISAADVLGGRVDPEALRGRIVFVGASAAALRDLRASPLDRSMPGVEIHATVADMIAANDFLSQPDWAVAVELTALIAMGLLSAALLGFAPAAVLLLPFAALAAGSWLGAASLLAHARLYVSPLFPLLVLALNFAILTFLKFWREERQKRFLHGAFARYVAPAVVARIVARPQDLTLSGEERDITILFSDVRGFTSISERLSPSQVSELLHRYFTPMTRIIVSHLGTMDKFIGDAIMAFWNAPVPVPNHPAQAVRAALEMTVRLAALNEAFRRDFGFAIACGIGLHRGRVRVGNFGSEDLFDYTVIGDAVNLASRLEGLTKFYGVRVLATDSLRHEAISEAAFIEIDLVRVKGKTVPVMLYSVISHEERRQRAGELDAAEAARKLYTSRKFADAATAYAKLAADHDRRFYAIFAERAAHLRDTPPPESWDGVFEHTAK
ncbi:Adenylate cyclase [Desulfovibrio sp. TomC]|nr:Adenylate cyclase [Desulfovibrio sp. TomC]